MGLYASGAGDFVGPASSTLNALIRFADTSGKVGKNSGVIADDSGNVSGIGTLITSDRAFMGADRFAIQYDRVAIGNSMAYSWSASPTNSASNTFIFRDADNVVALRNSTNGQTFILSRTYTDASNYAQVAMVLTGSTFAFTTQEAGTGIGSVAAYSVDRRLNVASYTVATLPSASTASGMIYVSDAAVAPCIAFTNGTNWKRCDNAATTVV